MLTEQGLHLRREVTDLKKEEERRDNINTNLLPQMNRYIVRLMYVPANGHAAADEHLEMALEEPTNIINHARNSNSTPLVARLSKCARSLHALRPGKNGRLVEKVKIQSDFGMEQIEVNTRPHYTRKSFFGLK